MTVRTYLNSYPTIDSSAYIDPKAEIIGNVTIGKDSSVWPMAVIRGDMHHITIGERTSIQDGCVLHITHDGPYCPGGASLSIGNDVTVGHQATLHACTIEESVLIGIGAVVLDKAVIQNHVLLGACSLVPPGKVLESGFLWVGSPVKKVRPLTENEMTFFKYSANRYVQLKNDYLLSK